MRIKLISEPDKKFKPIVQVLLNRGMEQEKILPYLNSTIAENVIEPGAGFGEELLKQGAKMLISTIAADKPAFVIVD